MPLLHGLNVVFYNVSDFARAKQFYGETLGLPLIFASDEFGWAEYGKAEEPHIAINLWPGTDPMPQGGGATAVFTVDDAYAATAELLARGVRCDDVMVVPGMVTLGTFYDPDGNRMQLASPLPPAEA